MRARTLGAAMLCAALVGCAGPVDDGGKGDGTAATKYTKVTLASVNNMMHLADFVAVQKGFFTKHGLDVRLDVLSSGSALNKALQSGNAEFTGTGSTSIPLARNGGIDAQLVAPAMNDATTVRYAGPLGIIGRKDRGVRPNDPSSLVGKKIAALSGSTNEEYLKRYLEKHDIALDDVSIVPLTTEDHPVSLKQGDVDAVSSWEPYVSQEISELGNNAAVVSRGDPLIGYFLGVGALRDTIGKRGDVMAKFAAGMAETMHWMRQHPEEAAAQAVNFINGLKLADAKAAMPHLKFDPRITKCTVKAFDEVSAEYLRAGQIEKKVPGEDMVDTSFMEKVEKENPEWFADLPPLPETCRD
ncbi:MAG: transporter substrate-binding domain-containing protein [Streptosporangiales bacterium]|nr:transporter substrate-binding domain-containing protein [Streptosporangiales bacterium]